jgi:hypothetical protein
LEVSTYSDVAVQVRVVGWREVGFPSRVGCRESGCQIINDRHDRSVTVICHVKLSSLGCHMTNAVPQLDLLGVSSCIVWLHWVPHEAVSSPSGSPPPGI